MVGLQGVILTCGAWCCFHPIWSRRIGRFVQKCDHVAELGNTLINMNSAIEELLCFCDPATRFDQDLNDLL